MFLKKTQNTIIAVMIIAGTSCGISQTENHESNNGTTRTLYLVRHAKSCWDDSSLRDDERPLNKRGLRDAPFMGQLLKELGVFPQIMISSPANRAITTAKIIAEEIGYDTGMIEQNPSVYEASTGELLDIIHNLDDSISSVMLVGHNPGFTGIANYLLSEYFDNVPTCGIVAISFNSSWKDIKRNTGTLVFYEYPKKHSKQTD